MDDQFYPEDFLDQLDNFPDAIADDQYAVDSLYDLWYDFEGLAEDGHWSDIDQARDEFAAWLWDEYGIDFDEFFDYEQYDQDYNGE